jgi:predicted acyltransferase
MSSTQPVTTAPPDTSLPKSGLGRLASLDAFRGLTMLLMVLVNSAGSSAVYRQLEHTEWHGLTLADLIFPSFVWIVGITTTLSLGSRALKEPKSKLVKQVFLRSLKMYVLGLCLYAAPQFNLHTQRILGVLQRIAICYLVGSLLYLFTGRKTQIVTIVVLLGGYWALMTLVPAPGFQPGDLTMQGNLAHYVDRVVLGAHNYANTKTWDPEGVLSTLPAIATMLLGIMAGYELQRKTALRQRLQRLAIAGCILLAAGLVVNHWFPINKKLWSTSFVLTVAGVDCLMLPLFTYWMDIRGHHRSLKPFIVMGMNAISVYMLSELLDQALSLIKLHTAAGSISVKDWLFITCFQPLASPQMASFLYAAAYTLLMYAVAYILYRRHIFFRI